MAWSKQLLKLACFCVFDVLCLKALDFCWRNTHPVTPTEHNTFLALQMLPDATWVSKYDSNIHPQ